MDEELRGMGFSGLFVFFCFFCFFFLFFSVVSVSFWAFLFENFLSSRFISLLFPLSSFVSSDQSSPGKFYIQDTSPESPKSAIFLLHRKRTLERSLPPRNCHLACAGEAQMRRTKAASMASPDKSLYISRVQRPFTDIQIFGKAASLTPDLASANTVLRRLTSPSSAPFKPAPTAAALGAAVSRLEDEDSSSSPPASRARFFE